MTPAELGIYGFVQGATEFLPVSSSAHLYALEALFAWPEAGRALAVASHTGTLAAVLLACRRQVVRLAGGALMLARGEGARAEAREALRILIGSLPLFAAGAVLAVHVPAAVLAQLPVMAAATGAGALLLLAADRGWIRLRPARPDGVAVYAFLGLMQALALVPGASRAGCVMTAARLAGWDRTAAANAALVLGLPAIAGATAVEAWGLAQSRDPGLAAAAAAVSATAFGAALAAIWLLLRWLRRRSFLPFVLYRLVLAGLLASLALAAPRTDPDVRAPPETAGAVDFRTGSA